jgi:hypothetical protein
MRPNVAILLALSSVVLMGAQEESCSGGPPTSDQIQRDQQERLLAEGTSQTGMPAIINFRERKMMKQILELRDQASFSTYTYVFSTMTGKLIPFCHSIGYPIPYSTQYTNPLKPIGGDDNHWIAIGQADPNGLFSPPSSDGTWVMCQNPAKPNQVMPIYSEPKLVGSPWALNDEKFPGDK